ncbi:ketoacyl-synt-domain-containing protein [Panus rudis PR-1116 ss-1]|nr:ketoacyl-synt-domain-containing protein [Panus rudis PR-1116 ss-1]
MSKVVSSFSDGRRKIDLFILQERVDSTLTSSCSRTEPIAIIGMAVKFPQADDTDALWNILENGLNTVSKIPSTRFHATPYQDASSTGRSMKTSFGNFLHDPASFDHTFFRVSPREARCMSPQQRILLQTAYHALEHAGYVPNATPCFDPLNMATYVGVATNEYVQNLQSDIDVYYSTGTLQAFLSGKLSYAFGFGGPSVVLDTSCSSSMVAIYQACRSLASRDCDAAIAGGVNVITSPDMYIGLDRAHFLSPTGQCKPWDASADGYCRSEGCGMFVLKRLSDAQAENDRILGVIRAIEINQSANAESITHPHIPTQIALFERLAASAGISPLEVSVVEAHGTGTRAGDPAELASIRAVFSKSRPSENPLHVTSIKANIGHAEAASGAASLAKLLLMFRERAIPPTISLRQLNPAIPVLDTDNTRIDTELCPWLVPPAFRKRMAVLNNFGAAGSNTALLLEEPPSSTPHPDNESCGISVVLGFSCDTETALEVLRADYIQHLNEDITDSASLANFAYTSTARRQIHQYRICVSGGSKEELIHEMKKAKGMHIGGTGQTAFVFSGQGAHYMGMGRDLYRRLASFREIIDGCHATLLRSGFPGILHLINPHGILNNETDTDSISYQSAVFALEYALASLWISWGVKPSVVVGHSLGEYAALVIAGVLELEHALVFVATRARLIAEQCLAHRTGMLAVRASSREIQATLESLVDFGGEISFACHNSPADCVVAGEISALGALKPKLEESRIRSVLLDVPFAYHTAAMVPVMNDLRKTTSNLPLSPPTLPILSTVYGRLVVPGDPAMFDGAYFAEHCVKPVLFKQAIADLLENSELGKVTTWIEIGPHPTILPVLRRCISSEGSVCIPSLRRGEEDWQTLCASLSRLYCTATTVNWRKVYADLCPGACLVDLPWYPFAKTKFWVDYEDPYLHPHRTAPSAGSIGLSTWSRVNAERGKSRIMVPRLMLLACVNGHRVHGVGLCPASAYIQAVCEAIPAMFPTHVDPRRNAIMMSDIVYSKPLTSDTLLSGDTYVDVLPSSDAHHSPVPFQVTSGGMSDQIVHCSGVLHWRCLESVGTKLAKSGSMIERRRDSILAERSSEVFRQRTIYSVIFPRIVEYSPEYHTIISMSVHPNGIDSFASVKLREQLVDDPIPFESLFTDTLIHAAGFAVNLSATQDQAYICAKISKLDILPEYLVADSAYGIYCNIHTLSSTECIADSWAMATDGSLCGTVVARAKGVTFRKVSLAALDRVLSSTRTSTSAPSGLSAKPDIVPSADSSMTLVSGDPVLSYSSYSASGTNPNEEPFVRSNASSPQSDFVALHPSTSLNGSLSVSRAMSDTVTEVRNVIASVLGMSPFEVHDDMELARLGLDSLMSIEIQHAIYSTFGVKLPAESLYACKLVSDLQIIVTERLTFETLPAPTSQVLSGFPSIEQQPTPVLLQTGHDRDAVPLFLIHDGSGMVFSYARLESLGCPVYGIQNPLLCTGEGWKGGILEMASHYAELIKVSLAARADCMVGGWSIGGIIAFEVARKLVADGLSVQGLILIDCPQPDDTSALPDSVIDTVFSSEGLCENPLVDIARDQMRASTRMLSNYNPTQSNTSSKTLKAVILRCREPVPMDAYSQDTASMSWLTERSDPRQVTVPWEDFLGTNLPFFDIPGHHFSAFDSSNVSPV